MVYEWKKTFKFKNADANKVKKELASLGDYEPEDVVKKAKDPETELHKCFEWDRDKVYEIGLIQQARQLVCAIVIASPKREIPEIRAFVSVVSEGKRVYKLTEDVVNNVLLKDQLIIDTMKSIKELENKLIGYRYLSDNVEKLSDKITETRIEIEDMNLIDN